MNPTGFSNPQVIAEDKVLDYFRREGVFTPPENDVAFRHKYASTGGIKQSVNFERMLLAVVRMYRSEGHGDPRIMQRLLLKAMEDNII